MVSWTLLNRSYHTELNGYLTESKCISELQELWLIQYNSSVICHEMWNFGSNALKIERYISHFCIALSHSVTSSCANSVLIYETRILSVAVYKSGRRNIRSVDIFLKGIKNYRNTQIVWCNILKTALSVIVFTIILLLGVMESAL